MKKIISIALLLTMILTITPFAFASGDGVIEISTKEEFDDIRKDLSGNYKLVADIEFTAADFAEGGAFYNKGKGFIPIGCVPTIMGVGDEVMQANPFTGTLNGNGHVIKGLQINTKAEEDYLDVGLFGINSGTIENLGLVNCSVTAKFKKDEDTFLHEVNVGAFAAYNAGIIIRCYNTAVVTATIDGDVKAQVGGIAGSSSGIIQNCYNTGNITGTSNSEYWVACGGIVGYTEPSAREDSCYNVGTVTSTTKENRNNYMGGIVGYNYSTVSKSYYLGAEKPIGREANNKAQTATKLTATNATVKETYANFDFETVWKIEAGQTPALKVFQHIHVEDTQNIIIDTKATCKQTGIAHTACGTCFIPMTTGIIVEIDPNNHVEDATMIVDKAANCKETGTGHYVCKLCGKTTRSNVTIPTNDSHSAGNWTVETYPKFTVGGTEVKRCTRCNKVVERRNTVKLTAFPDVKAGWYYDAVEYTVARGIFSGTPNAAGKIIFAPDNNTTRAEVVSVLARVAGVDTTKYTANPFTDVPEGKWFTGAVKWAVQVGVTAGITPTTFKPNDKVTREQFASFLVRFAEKQLGKTMPKLENAITFTDAAKISSWAKASVTACVRADIINGIENKNKAGTFSFDPQGNATRAQLAVMMRLFMKNVVK